MSRYRGPKIRILKRLGKLPNFTKKVSNSLKRHNRRKKRKKNSWKKEEIKYVTRLKEKQKLRFNYGLTETQLYNYIKEARRRRGVTGLILLQLLETRLDSICFRLGFGKTIGQVRQFINHGHIIVNNDVIDIPSFQCYLRDKISIKNKKNSKLLIKKNFDISMTNNLPSYLKFNKSGFEGIVIDYCDRKEVVLNLKELLVIEYYSRR